MDIILNGPENGKHTGMILIDLQKAFDALDHKILLYKMKCTCFCDKTIKWFDSYLTKRALFFLLDNLFSEAESINCRDPQGSTFLGPLVFLLYINDIPQPLTNSHIHLYADNTSIFYQHEEVKGIENVLNKKSANVCEWFLDNHFGVDKLNYYFL